MCDMMGVWCRWFVCQIDYSLAFRGGANNPDQEAAFGFWLTLSSASPHLPPHPVIVFHRLGAAFRATSHARQRYPGESCSVLEEVCLGWCPHLLEVEALLLKIRNAGVDGQVQQLGGNP